MFCWKWQQKRRLDEEEVAIVMEIAEVIEKYSITKTNELFYAGAVVVTNRLGVKIDKVAGRKEPMWKRRLQNKIEEIRKDVSQLEA